ncbi:MAG: hypothetical protein KDB94_05245 [Acidobacteria bacterium]|nr:hypothetical protein [Acidobacteriota bacterium]
MRTPRRLLVASALALSVALLPAPAAGDRVVLKNGRVLDDVAVAETPEGIRIGVGGGELLLPHGQVVAIEKASSSVEEFAKRATALRGRTAGADEWLDLARWARERGYDFGVRVATLEAAAFAPALAEVARLLRPLGYEQGPDGDWLPYDDAMRLRGWVEWEGEWLPPEVAQSKADARAEEREAARRRAADARAERVAALAEAKLIADLTRPEAPTYVYTPVWSAWGVPVVPALPVPQPRGVPEAGAGSSERLRPQAPSAPRSTHQGIHPGGSKGPPR